MKYFHPATRARICPMRQRWWLPSMELFAMHYRRRPTVLSVDPTVLSVDQYWAIGIGQATDRPELLANCRIFSHAIMYIGLAVNESSAGFRLSGTSSRWSRIALRIYADLHALMTYVSISGRNRWVVESLPFRAVSMVVSLPWGRYWAGTQGHGACPSLVVAQRYGIMLCHWIVVLNKNKSKYMLVLCSIGVEIGTWLPQLGDHRGC